MADPFTALMYAVQVMNFLKTLILRTLRERKDSVVESNPRLYPEPSDENRNHSLLESCQQDTAAEYEEAQENFVSEISGLVCFPESLQRKSSSTGGESGSLISSSESPVCNEDLYCEYPPKGNTKKSKSGQSSSSNARKGTKKTRGQQPSIHRTTPVEKKGMGSSSQTDTILERIDARR